MKHRTIALAGGVGGAKLAFGLSKTLGPEQLTIVANTGDDEEFFGLYICPDIDTITYTLAGINNTDTGWGIQDDTFDSLEILQAYGYPSWFKLGSKDLATHISRTDLMRKGQTLSEITSYLAKCLGIRHTIVPMSEHRIRTVLDTNLGCLSFQEYFVKYHCDPEVTAIRFNGATKATPSAKFVESLDSANSLIFCPSNPYLSVAPILAIPGVREKIAGFSGLRLAVSPIVGNKAVRGPAAKIMSELGLETSCVAVAKEYVGLCDIFVIDQVDAARVDEITSLGLRTEILDTMMHSDKDKIDLSQRILDVITRD